MRLTFDNVAGYGRSVAMTGLAVARVRSSYLASRWVQAPITIRREADT